MVREVAVFGTIAGLIVGIPLFGLTIALQHHPDVPWGMYVGYLTMLIALSTVFVAVKRRRDRELGGVIGFWPALGMGLAISAVAGMFYVIAWEAALAATHMAFVDAYAAMLIEHQRAAGVSGDALARAIAESERFKQQYANPLYRVPMTFAEIFPIGVVVSVLSAALLCNPRFLRVRRTRPAAAERVASP